MEKVFSESVKVKVDAAAETVQLSVRLSEEVVVIKRMPLQDWKRMESEVRQQLADQR